MRSRRIVILASAIPATYVGDQPASAPENRGVRGSRRSISTVGATFSPPKSCKTSQLTCSASRYGHGLCRYLTTHWSRHCNRIFVSCYNMHGTAYLYDALG